MDESLAYGGLSIVRYPKGSENVAYEQRCTFTERKSEDAWFSHTAEIEEAEVVIISYGRISYEAYRAAELLSNDCKVGIIKLKQIAPLDGFVACLDELAKNAKLVYILEEGIRSGGVGEKLSSKMMSEGCKKKVVIGAIEDYVYHGSLQELLTEHGLVGEQIAKQIKNEVTL
jgi:1-deoxy-D-xylulose-5-phosphate synthase